MWYTADQFHFAWKKIKGDFIIRATVKFIGKGTDDHRKIGIIARDNLNTDSRYADACVHGDILSSLQYRAKDGDSTFQVELSTYHPTEIELERTGNTFTFSAAVFGEPYKSVSKEIVLNDEVYAGLFLCSHRDDVMEKAEFSNVQIIIPPGPDWQPVMAATQVPPGATSVAFLLGITDGATAFTELEVNATPVTK